MKYKVLDTVSIEKWLLSDLYMLDIFSNIDFWTTRIRITPEFVQILHDHFVSHVVSG